MLSQYESEKAKAKPSVDVKERSEFIKIAEPSSDPAAKLHEMKDKMAKYIEDNTDYFSTVSSKEAAKERIQYQLDYLFGLRSIYEYTINPNNDLNTAVWKAIVNVLNPSLPETLKMHLGR